MASVSVGYVYGIPGTLATPQYPVIGSLGLSLMLDNMCHVLIPYNLTLHHDKISNLLNYHSRNSCLSLENISSRVGVVKISAV